MTAKPEVYEAEVRRSAIARLQPMIDRIDARSPRKVPSEPRETHDEALARLAREYAASPVGLTPEALKGRLA